MNPADLAASARAGDRRSLARLISLVEDEDPRVADAVRALGAFAPRAKVLGITGAPGAGKSTLVSRVVGALRAREETVSVLAVDPSSPFTGGALLGDRLRMQDHATDPGVFIRSMATRGHLGGLAWAVPHALRVLDAAGADVIVLETVGVGQAEVDITHTADTTVVVLAPGMGDSVQANKAGILEIADIFAVNKADRDGARDTVRDLQGMLHLGAARAWEPPVVQTVATEGTGIDDLLKAIDEHRAHLETTGGLRARRIARAKREVAEIALATVRARMAAEAGGLDDVAAQVAEGALDPYAAADTLAP